MALKNLKEYVPPIKAHNIGIVKIDQLELTGIATAPTDSFLANGRIYYDTALGQLRGRINGSWKSLGAGASGGASDWDSLYAADKSMTISAAAMTFAGTHATNDVFVITNASGTGDCLQITNSGSGDDIEGTSDTWAVTKAGAATFVSIDGCDALTAAASLTLEATSTGTITIGGTSSGNITIGGGGGTLTATTDFIITGSADADVLTITDGDVLMSNGILQIVSDDTTSGSITITASAYAGQVVSVTADSLTSGSALYVDSSGEANFSGDGGYLNLTLSGTSVFKVQRYGATVIAGNAGTAILTITAGDVVLSEGSISLTDDDNAASLTVINDGATTVGAASSDEGIVDLEFDELTTGQGVYIEVDKITSGSALSIDNGGNTMTTGYYIECGDDGTAVFTVGDDGAIAITSIVATTTPLTITSVATAADIVSIAASALTTGDAMVIASNAETLAAGELLKITNTEDGDISATPKTGNLVSVTSSITATTEDTTLAYDAMLISRSNIVNQGTKTLTTSGSVLKLLNTSTDSAGTCTDTTVVLEIEQAEGGTAAPTGDVVLVTSVGVGAQALSVVSASTTASDVLITSSGAKASNKAALEVTTSGATAAGGAVLRVSHSGDPAAATGYLADFDSTGGSTTNNAIGVIIQHEGTGAPLKITTAGAAANGVLHLESTEAGATGVILKLDHQSATAADADVICRIQFSGNDDAGTPADNDYARIDVVAADTAAASEDGDMLFYVCRAGTETLQLKLDSDVNGIIVGDDSAAAIITSAGTDDLELTTNNNGGSEPKIVITDGSNSDITITPSGTGLTNIVGLAPTVTAHTTTATLTEAEGGIIKITTGSTWTATLPSASGNSGLWYCFKKTDATANALTIDGADSETIDGSATNTEVDAQYDTMTIVCDGSNWHIIAKEIAA